MVRVEYNGPLRNLIGIKEEEVNVWLVVDVMRQIDGKYGKKTSTASKCSFVLVNGKNAALLNEYRTKLNPGDVVKIMPVTAGGLTQKRLSYLDSLFWCTHIFNM